MKKTVILSTNDHPDYIQYLPYVQKAWNKLGWHTLTFLLADHDFGHLHGSLNKIVAINAVPGYKDCTVVQVYRLLAHNFIDGLIMTTDVDMIPMSDYWMPDPNEITCYGIDLTGDEQIPMCYVAMNHENWAKIIPEKTIQELLSKYPQAASIEFQKYWFTDQNILTERILHAGIPFTRIDRGIYKNLAVGRVDRADWERTIAEDGTKIDAHMPRPFDAVQAERIMNMTTAPTSSLI